MFPLRFVTISGLKRFLNRAAMSAACCREPRFVGRHCTLETRCSSFMIRSFFLSLCYCGYAAGAWCTTVTRTCPCRFCRKTGCRVHSGGCLLLWHGEPSISVQGYLAVFWSPAIRLLSVFPRIGPFPSEIIPPRKL